MATRKNSKAAHDETIRKNTESAKAIDVSNIPAATKDRIVQAALAAADRAERKPAKLVGAIPLKIAADDRKAARDVSAKRNEVEFALYHARGICQLIEAASWPGAADCVPPGAIYQASAAAAALITRAIELEGLSAD